MPDQKVLTEEEIGSVWQEARLESKAGYGAYNVKNRSLVRACVESFARRIEAAVLAKRDAEWREVVLETCDKGYTYTVDGVCHCPACRTVARMEGK